MHLWLCDDRRLAENTACYLRVTDLEALHRELRAASLERISAPEARPWGTTELHVWYPSGNLLRFGQPTADRDRG